MEFDYFNDLVKIIIEDEELVYGKKFAINKDKLECVKELCKAVATLENEISFSSFEAGIDEDTGYLEFKIESDCFTITNDSSVFYILLESALKFEARNTEDGNSVVLKFLFEDVWEYVG